MHDTTHNTAIDPKLFRQACGRFATGITITTVLSDAGTPHGITVNSFTSVSLGPPLVLVCIDHRSHVIEHFQQDRYFGVNILNENQQDLSQRFARREANRFEGVDWYSGQTGAPLLPGSLAIFECRLFDRRSAGDHLIMIGEVIHATVSDGQPLTYFQGGYRLLTHDAPPAAHAEPHRHASTAAAGA